MATHHQSSPLLTKSTDETVHRHQVSAPSVPPSTNTLLTPAAFFTEVVGAIEQLTKLLPLLAFWGVLAAVFVGSVGASYNTGLYTALDQALVPSTVNSVVTGMAHLDLLVSLGLPLFMVGAYLFIPMLLPTFTTVLRGYVRWMCVGFFIVLLLILSGWWFHMDTLEGSILPRFIVLFGGGGSILWCLFSTYEPRPTSMPTSSNRITRWLARWTRTADQATEHRLKNRVTRWMLTWLVVVWTLLLIVGFLLGIYDAMQAAYRRGTTYGNTLMEQSPAAIRLQSIQLLPIEARPTHQRDPLLVYDTVYRVTTLNNHHILVDSFDADCRPTHTYRLPDDPKVFQIYTRPPTAPLHPCVEESPQP